ncbi:M1 family aminopeptidase [Hugenholtzia roseola]|uniref:M1 family aminopeptidase n=1 Tax=Hugenholtzia roseola TaxID=1002 RepID=UPI00040B0CAD|nr:M1 family aminopeptidase [Hugenholtzia roseola]
MLLETIRFELQYRFKRPATFLYFAIIFLLTFLAFSTDAVIIGGAAGAVKINAPTNIATILLIITAFFMMITSAIMGVAVLRDFEHKTDALLFTTPMAKRDYLFGRFIGSFLILIFVFSGALLGMIAGSSYVLWFGDAQKLQPFNLWHFVQPFLLFGFSNLFISGVLMFAGGALSRKMLVVYTQGVLLLVLYLVTSSIGNSLEYKELTPFLDPFGISAFNRQTEYWSIVQKNTELVGLEGYVLYNRLIWVGIAFLGLILLYNRFSFRQIEEPLFKKKANPKPQESTSSVPKEVVIPKASFHFGIQADFLQVGKMTLFYLKNLFKEVAFIAIVLAGMIQVIVGSLSLSEIYGVSPLPKTFFMTESLSGFSLFFLIIIVFYTGELFAQENQYKLNFIIDATPIKDWIILTSKVVALIGAQVVLLFALLLTGIGVQTFKGYFDYEISIYLITLFTDFFMMIVLYTLLGFFIQSMVNNKFVGYILLVVFFITEMLLAYLHIEHPLFNFASGADLGTYSDMNGFGHFFKTFTAYALHWLAFACLLFGVAVYFVVRGTETSLKTRFRLGKQRLTGGYLTLMGFLSVAFLASSAFIFYNVNVVGEYKNSKELEQDQVAYEETLKKYESLAQPKIIATNLKVDLFPKERKANLAGFFILQNKTNAPLSEIHLQTNGSERLEIEKLYFSRPFEVKQTWERFTYTIYKISPPLQPDDTLRLDFEIKVQNEGFSNSTDLVYNGTFFNNTNFLPALGYNSDYELTSDDKRREYGLAIKERTLERNDPQGLRSNLFGDDADRIDFEIVLSTEADQIAIAPGYLQKEWKENGRAYFHYKMDVPMVNFFSIVSARYEVMRDKWVSPSGKEVALEIYYHKPHTYNLERMMRGMKDALSYFSKNFSEYQYRQMRIMEFPRYATFAQSFANTIPYSEGIGFILDIGEQDIDVNYYVTAHEAAHQWWGHQVTEAAVRGSSMLSESLSQYGALMVMKHHYPQERIQAFLRHELDSYLSGRSAERKKERPLVEVEGQQYIHYNKGSLIFYAFQDYVGEERVNLALQNYIKKWQYSQGRYPNTEDLMQEFRAVTPDSLQFLIEDWFEKITFYQNKVVEVEAKLLAGDRYQVRIKTESEKVQADTLGNEKTLPFREWVDIGIYVEGKDPDKPTLAYLKKHPIKGKENEFILEVKGKPIKAGIDPLNILIDRFPKDNVKEIKDVKDIEDTK